VSFRKSSIKWSDRELDSKTYQAANKNEVYLERGEIKVTNG